MRTSDTAAVRAVLAARVCPDAAVLAVTLRGGHWPYSCGLASSVLVLAAEFSAAGAEVVLLTGGQPEGLRALATAWRLPFDWLPQDAVRPVAEELLAWDVSSARALDAVGLLGPSGSWLSRQDFDDPGGVGSLDAVLTTLRRMRLPAVPSPADPDRAPEGAAGAVEPVLRTLRRAHASAERLVLRLPRSPAAERAERTRRRLAGYLRAVEAVGAVPGRARFDSIPG